MSKLCKAFETTSKERTSDLQYFKKNVPTEFIEGLSVAHLFAEVEEALAQLCGQAADRANNYLVDAKGLSITRKIRLGAISDCHKLGADLQLYALLQNEAPEISVLIIRVSIIKIRQHVLAHWLRLKS